MNQPGSDRQEPRDPAIGCPALVGPSAGIRRARSAVRTAARVAVPSLIVRERGCLGDAVARAIHDAGGPSGALFVSVDCALASSQELVVAFAGDPYGLVARLHGRPPRKAATVFLDRIEQLSAPTQAALAHELSRGDRGWNELGIRLVAGTHEDLRDHVSDGRFRQDLFYQLAVLAIELPPLRARREDIVPSLESFVADVARMERRPTPTVSPRVSRLCESYHWPGNTRELQCVARRLLASSSRTALDPRALPAEVRHPSPPPTDRTSIDLPPQGVNLDELERRLIQQALGRQSGNRTRTARMLGLTRQQLLYRMKKHGLR